MPSDTYSLGELEHVYDRQNLKLTNSGLIRISSSQAFEFPFSLNFQDLETLVSSEVWVAGGNQLQIELHISFDDIEIAGQEGLNVTEGLGLVLCSAEIWSQLNLNASLSLPENQADKGPFAKTLLITLTSQPSSHTNIQPPAGIPSARLESVSFTMKFSTCRRTRLPTKERKQLTMHEMSVNKSQSRILYQSRESLDRRWNLACQSHIVGCMIGGDEQRELITESDLLIGPVELPLASKREFVSGTTSTVRSLDSTLSTKTSQSAEAYTPSFESSAPRSKYSTHKVDLDELFKIVNASLHVMICGHRPAKAGGIVLSSDEGYPKLATLSPVLFAPGYARAISQCRPLFPNISHTISGIYCHTRSLALKRKMEQLLDIATDRYIQEERPLCEVTESRNSELTSAVNARLWFLIQRRSKMPPTSTKIKAFDAPRSSELDHTLEEMLDESLMEDREEEAMFDSQDTLLAEDFSQGQELLNEDAMDWEDLEDDLLMDEETLVEHQIVKQDHPWKELEEEDLFCGSQSRFESNTERANAQRNEVPLEDETEEILEDQIAEEYPNCLTRDRFGSNRWHDELLEDIMISTPA